MEEDRSYVETLQSWDVVDVCNWLKSCGLGNFVKEFSDMVVRGDFLVELYEMTDDEIGEVLFDNKKLLIRKFKCELKRLLYINANNDGLAESKETVHRKRQRLSSLTASSHTDSLSLTTTSSASSVTSDFEQSLQNQSNECSVPSTSSASAERTTVYVELKVEPSADSYTTKMHVKPRKHSTKGHSSSNRQGSKVDGTSTSLQSVSSTDESSVITANTLPSLPSQQLEDIQPTYETEDPRGPPILLKRSMLHDPPFNWYWICSTDKILNNAFWYITKYDENGKQYSSTKKLKDSPLVFGVDYFASESAAFDKAIEMYKDTVNYVKNPKTMNS